MLPYFWYILKAIICSGILFGYYWLFLRNKVFHQYNRFYLLSAIALSLLLPLVKIDFWQNNDLKQPGVIKVLQAVSAGDDYMNTVIITANKNDWSVQQLYPLVYWMVSLILLLVLLKTLFAIWSLLKKYPVKQLDKVSFVNTDDKSTPFSFLKYIFWNDGIDIDTQTGKQIFKHEVAHIQEKHTHDKLFLNILLIFFWCNPFFWLYRKELNMIHEFIADKKAVEDSDTASFAAMILQATYPQHRFELANNFFYSPIKRRLLMLTKNNNPRVNYFARVMVLPLAVLIFAAFTFKTKHKTSFYHGKKITVVIDAGHGGLDDGIKSAAGILEKDLTLAIAKKIKDINSNDAIEIVLVRESDVYMDPRQKTEFAKNKNADLVISLHIDGTPKPNQKSGLSFHIAKDEVSNANSSKILASALMNEFNNNYRLPVWPAPLQNGKSAWILKSLDCPTVLIEAGFMTNEKDISYLETNEAKETIAKNVLAAIEKFAVAKNENTNLQALVPVNDTIPSTIFINTKHADANYLKSEDYKTKALVIVDSKEIGNLGCNYMENSSNKYSSAVIYGPAEAKKKYGEKGNYGALKLTVKEVIAITADSVFFDEKNRSIQISGGNTSLKGDFSNTLIYVEGKIATPEELNMIPPAKVSSINILKGDKLDDIVDAKGKTAVIYVNLKPDDLSEVVLTAARAPREQPVAIALDKMNVLYIGVVNPVTIAVADVPSDKLIVDIDNGSITGSNGKYNAVVTQTGTATIKVTTVKDDRKVVLSTQTFRVRLIPAAVNGQVPIDFDIKLKQDSALKQVKENQMLLLLEQNKAKPDVSEKAFINKNLQAKELLTLKQNFEIAQQNNKTYHELLERQVLGVQLKSIQDTKLTTKQKLLLEQQNKLKLDLVERKVAGIQLTDHDLQSLNKKITSAQQNKLKYDLAERALAGTQLKFKDQQVLNLNQKLLLEQQNKANLDYTEKLLQEKSKDAYLEKALLYQKEILARQNNLVFVKTEISPQFTGGDEAWRKYLRENLKAATPVDEGWKAGKYTLIVKFIVHTDGTVSDVTTENYKGSKTAQHCIGIILKAPKWQPAVQNGHQVNAYKKQPITFVIEE